MKSWNVSGLQQNPLEPYCPYWNDHRAPSCSHGILRNKIQSSGYTRLVKKIIVIIISLWFLCHSYWCVTLRLIYLDCFPDVMILNWIFQSDEGKMNWLTSRRIFSYLCWSFCGETDGTGKNTFELIIFSYFFLSFKNIGAFSEGCKGPQIPFECGTIYSVTKISYINK